MLTLPLALHVPMFGLGVFAFLLVCTILAIACFLVFKSGAKGETKLGGCAGCAIGFALLLIAGLAGAMFMGVMVLNAKSELVRSGPVRSVELDFGERGDDADVIPPEAPRVDSWDDAHDMERDARAEESHEHGGEPDALRPVEEGQKNGRHIVHLKLFIRGDQYPATIAEWVRENTEGDVSVKVSTEGDRTIVDLGFPFTREELSEFKREFEKALPGMKLPKGIRVEIKEVDE